MLVMDMGIETICFINDKHYMIIENIINLLDLNICIVRSRFLRTYEQHTSHKRYSHPSRYSSFVLVSALHSITPFPFPERAKKSVRSHTINDPEHVIIQTMDPIPLNEGIFLGGEVV